jgi:hypothetical protein
MGEALPLPMILSVALPGNTPVAFDSCTLKAPVKLPLLV